MKTSGLRKGYYIVSKFVGKSFSEYKGDSIKLSLGAPMTVDEVLIGNKKNPKEIKRITTFRDSSGKMTERVFDYGNKPLRFRLYDRSDYLIGEDEWVERTTSKEFFLKRSMLNAYRDFRKLFGVNTARDMITERGQTRHNFLSMGINDDEKRLSSIIINPEKQFETHEFIEFGEKPKKLFLSVDKSTYKVKTDNDLVANDEFLAMRGEDINDAKISFTKYFLKKRGIDNTKVEIKTDYIPNIDEEKLIAFYTSEDGSINFNKLYPVASKAKLAGTSAHETEHAWQWYLYARNTGGDTPYTKWLFKKFGPLQDEQLIKEADTYTEPIKNYVSFSDNYEEYKKNKIEYLACKKGKDAENEYNLQGKTIRELFKHIPPEVL